MTKQDKLMTKIMKTKTMKTKTKQRNSYAAIMNGKNVAIVFTSVSDARNYIDDSLGHLSYANLVVGAENIARAARNPYNREPDLTARDIKRMANN